MRWLLLALSWGHLQATEMTAGQTSMVMSLDPLAALFESFADSSLQIVTSIFGIGTELLRNLVGAERPSLPSVHAIPFNLCI